MHVVNEAPQAYGYKEDWQQGLNLQVWLIDVALLRLYYELSKGDEILAKAS